jgi:hypothetical protein
MTLTKENLSEWKQEVDRMMKDKVGMTLSETRTDEEWLRDCIGEEAIDVVTDELSYWNINEV